MTGGAPGRPPPCHPSLPSQTPSPPGTLPANAHPPPRHRPPVDRSRHRRPLPRLPDRRHAVAHPAGAPFDPAHRRPHRPVRITLDQDGVPRIQRRQRARCRRRARLLHARDRMFQMDLMRRDASGRLSEIAGPVTLPLDQTMRTLGLRRAAEADYAALPARHPGRAGGLRQRRERLDRPPRPLRRAGIPGARRAASMDAGRLPAVGRDDGPVAVAQLAHRAVAAGAGRPRAAAADRRAVARSRRPRPPRGCADPRRSPARGGRAADAGAAALSPSPFTLPTPHPTNGRSMARHTATGAPLLAGDPHLAFGFPGIWYLARIDTPDETLAGATAPGVPFLVHRPQQRHRLDLHHHRRRRAGRVRREPRSAATNTPRPTGRSRSSSTRRSSRSAASRTWT